MNLSARQFQYPGLVDDIDQTLREAGLPPERLQLEISEGVLMEDAEATLRMLGRLKGLGVRLAVDDFGTGYSSLAYLQRFPADALKIDKASVDDLAPDTESGAIVRAIVSLAHTLGLVVVAEGIETPEQLAQLQALGGLAGPGYYFAAPLPPGAVEGSLAGGWSSHASLSLA